MRDEAAIERRLERQAQTVFLGRLGDPTGVNVAKVEVSWYWDRGIEPNAGDGEYEGAGYYLVHAKGDGDKDIYETFRRRVDEAMDMRQERLGFDSFQIDDIYAA